MYASLRRVGHRITSKVTALQPDDILSFAAKYFADSRDGKHASAVSAGAQKPHCADKPGNFAPTAVASNTSDLASAIYGTSRATPMDQNCCCVCTDPILVVSGCRV